MSTDSQSLKVDRFSLKKLESNSAPVSHNPAYHLTTIPALFSWMSLRLFLHQSKNFLKSTSWFFISPSVHWLTWPHFRVCLFSPFEGQAIKNLLFRLVRQHFGGSPVTKSKFVQNVSCKWLYVVILYLLKQWQIDSIFCKALPRPGPNLGSLSLRLFSLTISASEHFATAPPPLIQS